MITVTDLTHLKRLASERRAVYCPRHATWAKWPKPAAFMINLPGAQLEQLFRLGLYVYDPAAQQDDDDAALRVPGVAMKYEVEILNDAPGFERVLVYKTGGTAVTLTGDEARQWIDDIATMAALRDYDETIAGFLAGTGRV